MDKIFDRLLVEFLIPAFLMLLCLLLAFDLLLGTAFDLDTIGSRKLLLNEGYLLVPAVLFAYLLNTSTSATFNLMLRKVCWGKIREYLVLRKLNVFKEGPLKGCTWWGYLKLGKKQRESRLNTVLKPDADNLYSEFMQRLERESISSKSVSELVDSYDNLRTIVMASGKNAVVDWIQYHWAQLRLARSAIVPAFLMVILLPSAICQWGYARAWVVAWLAACVIFLILQCMHYYYRERFMTYTMIGYLLLRSSKRENSTDDK